MARIREEVTIAAPAEAVWEAVHEDLPNVPRWAAYLRRAEALGPGPGRGFRARYHLELPGGLQTSLVLHHSTWDRPRRCRGRFAEGPLEGTWAYTYRERDGATRLTYEMDYELRGLLRLAGPLLKRDYESGIRDGMGALKRYVENGRAAAAAG